MIAHKHQSVYKNYSGNVKLLWPGSAFVKLGAYVCIYWFFKEEKPSHHDTLKACNRPQ